jgi:uncharacterized RDD family membrane protein YckC
MASPNPFSDPTPNPYSNPNPYASPTFVDDKAPRKFGGELASRGNRFLGALIDGLILLPISFGAGVVLGIALVASGVDPQGIQFSIIAAVVGGCLGAGAFLAVHGYLLATRGQTVGKMIMKTQIVSSDSGELLPLGTLILKRYVPLWVIASIPYVGGLVALANVLAIFRENHKCLHDEIAGTKVIQLM